MNINNELRSLVIYRNLLDDEITQNLIDIFDILNDPENSFFEECVSLYSDLCSKLFEKEISLSDYILDLILYDENIFSKQCSKVGFVNVKKNLRDAAFHDLDILFSLCALSAKDLKDEIRISFPKEKDFVSGLCEYAITDILYDKEAVGEFYEKNSFGVFAKYRAFLFNSDKSLKPVSNLDDIKLSDLKLYEAQREKVIHNTLCLLEGTPCCNVLLYGDRGTGKSSTVKAVLNEYSSKGLRMVQLVKDNIMLLPDLMERLGEIPLKFIIFVDDLTFNENDYNFGAMKTVLEGSLNKQPSNIAIYVTTNRRHLIKETFSSREGDEIHRADTIDDTISLSERFGLTITFSIPNKDNYLEIVRQIAEDRNLPVENDELFKGAERFALLKNGRTPRIARQYVDSVESNLKLSAGVK